MNIDTIWNMNPMDENIIHRISRACGVISFPFDFDKIMGSVFAHMKKKCPPYTMIRYTYRNPEHEYRNFGSESSSFIEQKTSKGI